MRRRKSVREMDAGELRLQWERGRTANERMAAFNERERRLRLIPDRIKLALGDVIDTLGVFDTFRLLASVCEERAPLADDQRKATLLALGADNLNMIVHELIAHEEAA